MIALRTSRQRGFTLWELMVVVSLVIFLFATAAWRLLPLRGDAEQAHILQTVGNIRSALGMQMAQRVVRGDRTLEALASENPLSWLRTFPPRAAPEAACWQGAPGRWQWCPEENLLVYRLRYPQYVELDPAREGFLRFQTQVAVDHGSLRGIEFVALDGLPVIETGQLEKSLSEETMEGEQDERSE